MIDKPKRKVIETKGLGDKLLCELTPKEAFIVYGGLFMVVMLTVTLVAHAVA